MKKDLALLLFVIFLTACSAPDGECWHCSNDIYLDNAYTVQQEYVCETCYENADLCECCSELYFDEYDRGYCAYCIDTNKVVPCSSCGKYFPEGLTYYDVHINDYWCGDSICHSCYDKQRLELCGIDTRSTWGNLVEEYGDYVWTSLTPMQRRLVKYPYFDANKVYVTQNGYAFHSVDWCYTLMESSELYYCTHDDAIMYGYTPCSKCVYFE